MNEKEEYCGSLEECLAKWSRRIDELEAEAKNAKGQKESEYRQKIDELHRIGKQMKINLDEIRKSAGHKWTPLKERADKIREELEASIDFPISRLR